MFYVNAFLRSSSDQSGFNFAQELINCTFSTSSIGFSFYKACWRFVTPDRNTFVYFISMKSFLGGETTISSSSSQTSSAGSTIGPDLLICFFYLALWTSSLGIWISISSVSWTWDSSSGKPSGAWSNGSSRIKLLLAATTDSWLPLSDGDLMPFFSRSSILSFVLSIADLSASSTLRSWCSKLYLSLSISFSPKFDLRGSGDD